MSHAPGKGQRRVKVSAEAIEAWLVHGNAVVTDLPNDARFMSLWRTDAGDCYNLLFESAEWDELYEGEVIPELELSIERRGGR